MITSNNPDTDLDKIDILLVDDRVENLLTLEAVIGSPYYNLIKANSGEAALRYLLHQEPALILMDVQMPNMDGFETASLIKSNKRTREIPIIFITATNNDVIYLHKGYNHGAVDYLYKPYDVHVLKSKISVFVDLSRKTKKLLQVEKQLRESESKKREQQIAQLEIRNLKKAEETLQKNKRRSDFLAEASLLLSESLDYESTIFQVGHLAVPKLADWYSIDVLDELGQIKYFTLPGTHLQTTLGVINLEDRFSHHTRKAEYYEAISDELLRKVAHNEDELNLLKNLVPQSIIIIPLIARGKTIGVMTILSGKTEHRYDELDLVMFEDLAHRAAIAIDNANLYKQAQTAIRTRDEFLSIASHELKTPITPLKIQIQLLLRTLNAGSLSDINPERIEKIIQISNRQLERLSRLIDNLLDISRITIGKLTLNLEEFDLIELIQDILDRFSNDLNLANCQVEFKKSNPLLVHWDRFRTEQVMINLLTNAIKYGPDHPIHILTSLEQDRVKVAIKDQGMGIAKEDQERIFNRFERGVSSKHSSGLGLGLYIVTQIIEAHNGRIHVESELGKGSTFIIELPLKAPEQTRVLVNSAA